jgi:hypothetical protein
MRAPTPPILAAALALLLAGSAGRAAPAAEEGRLPRFTEEREAAALFFVKKHLPELLPLLGELKKTSADRYRREVRAIFQVTELLADIEDERRYELELKIWKAENKAYTLVAKLSTPRGEERKKVEAALQDLAKELVELDIAVLELKAEQLDKELGETKDELAKMRDGVEKHVKERYQLLLEKANRPKT